MKSLHFKWEDKQLIYMQLRTVPLFLLYLIILIITLNINNFKNLHNTTYICCSLLTYWRSMIIPRTTILKTRSVRKSSQLHVKNEQLSSMNKWVFRLYLFINFFFFQYANLVFMLLVMKIIVIYLWLTMKSEVGSSNC